MSSRTAAPGIAWPTSIDAQGGRGRWPTTIAAGPSPSGVSRSWWSTATAAEPPSRGWKGVAGRFDRVSDAGFEPPPPPPGLTPPPGMVAYTGGPMRTGTIVRMRNFILIALVLIAASGIYQLIATPGLVDK